MTDHMLYMDFAPEHGWSSPEIKPYGPLSLDPACSCFQYCSSVFEGMKVYFPILTCLECVHLTGQQAYIDPDGNPRLFRPHLNMERMVRSAGRVALPVSTNPLPFSAHLHLSDTSHSQSFNADALLILIKRLVAIDARWIPRARGCSLYIRPTLIGTRPSLSVSASTHAALYVILSPTGPYICDPSGKGLALLAVNDEKRVRFGGPGGFKLGLNYAAGFPAQRAASSLGYQQIVWLVDETLAETGSMNVFVVFERPDGGTRSPSLAHPLFGGRGCSFFPPLRSQYSTWSRPQADGKNLPHRHSRSSLTTDALPQLPPHTCIHSAERALTMSGLFAASAAGTLREFFCMGAAAIVTPVARIGWQRKSPGENIEMAVEVTDIMLSTVGGQGSLAQALWERLVDIQGASSPDIIQRS